MCRWRRTGRATQALTIGGAPATDPAGPNLIYGEVFDPLTTRVVSGANVRTPFPNNTVPLTRFDSVALAIQNMLPMPNAPGIINNYNIPSYTNFVRTTTYLREVCRKAGCSRSARPV